MTACACGVDKNASKLGSTDAGIPPSLCPSSVSTARTPDSFFFIYSRKAGLTGASEPAVSPEAFTAGSIKNKHRKIIDFFIISPPFYWLKKVSHACKEMLAEANHLKTGSPAIHTLSEPEVLRTAQYLGRLPFSV
jgi:hypothetical protein